MAFQLILGDEDYPVKVTNNYKAGENGEVYVFNWGEYIDERGLIL